MIIPGSCCFRQNRLGTKLNKILSLTTIFVEGGEKVSCVGQKKSSAGLRNSFQFTPDCFQCHHSWPGCSLSVLRLQTGVRCSREWETAMSLACHHPPQMAERNWKLKWELKKLNLKNLIEIENWDRHVIGLPSPTTVLTSQMAERRRRTRMSWHSCASKLIYT